MHDKCGVGDVTPHREEVGLLLCMQVARAGHHTVTLTEKCLHQRPAEAARASGDDGRSCPNFHDCNSPSDCGETGHLGVLIETAAICDPTAT
jgi:hypothetical protein